MSLIWMCLSAGTCGFEQPGWMPPERAPTIHHELRCMTHFSFGHVNRKVYRYLVKIGQDKKYSEQVTVCLKMYTGLGEKREMA